MPSNPPRPPARPGRWAGLWRYALVGLLATAVHYAVLVTGVELGGWPAPLAAGTGAAVGAQVAYVGNRWFTFGRDSDVAASWLRFQLTAAAGAAGSVAVVAAGVAAGLHYLLAQAVATVVVMLLTYQVNRLWSFR